MVGSILASQTFFQCFNGLFKKGWRIQNTGGILKDGIILLKMKVVLQHFF